MIFSVDPLDDDDVDDDMDDFEEVDHVNLGTVVEPLPPSLSSRSRIHSAQ